MAAMCKVMGWDCCGRLNISRDRNSLCRHAGLDKASGQPKSLGGQDSSRRAEARRLDTGSGPV